MLKRLSLLGALFFSAAILSQTPGEPVQYLLSEINGSGANQLALTDGSLWRLTAPRALARGSAILISGRNLRTGNVQALSGGFQFDLSYQDGQLPAQQGYKLQLIASQQDGKQLLLENNIRLWVLDADRLESRHFRGTAEVILSADGQQLIYLPNLKKVQVRQVATP
ncbi:hypothetical protein H1D31_08610 [Alishewanella sp. BS5-314]|uniref:hypothetical protein n=1 Tax=Alishewanella sp. BS5-314 TaxID=2755587 RepID=UPI0021BAAA9D|nr:hypothetical protein [Alishewanella sp. BS5-314]MCT8126074.1 hypothetical protein [Alishewanella sp. BS5-314]